MTLSVIIVGVIGISVVLLALMFLKSNQVNLTGKTEEKPEWMSSNPPAETIAATKAEGEGVTLFNQDKGERIASPFAEQIEDMLRAKLKSHPTLKDLKVDIGTGTDYGFEFWVNEKRYASVDDLPNEELKVLFRETVKDWESRK
ncbi:MAG: hypothetical protein U0V02_03770 [Anaerolineales bacterium]